MAIAVERQVDGKAIIINTNHVAYVTGSNGETCNVGIGNSRFTLKGTQDELVRRLLLNQKANHYERNID